MRKKGLIYGVWILCLAFVITGCTKTDPETKGSGDRKKVFVFGDTTFNTENGEPDLNPHHDNSGWACIRYGVGETLFRFNDQMEIEPWLAKRYKNIDDFTWKVEIRKNISFTSGRRCDAEAVKECLGHLIKEQPRAAENLQIDHMAVQDDTLIIQTKVPVPALINYLADPYSCIFDLQSGITKDGIVQGTGPYQAVYVESDREVRLVKNKNYWNGMPKIDEIIVKTITDGDTMAMALQSGEIDAAYGMPYVNYPLFENKDFLFSGCVTSRVFFGTMNFKSEITGDPAVRKAIAMGIAKEGFVKALLDGNGSVASGPYPSDYPFGGDAVTAPDYDKDEAKRILEQAGWKDTDGDGIREKNGVPLILRWLTYPSRQELPLLAESAQATLGEIGFQVEINNTANHNSIRTDSDAWDIYVSAFVTAPTGDPEYFFSNHCLDHSSYNDGHYHNTQLEKLATKMSKTFDIEKRWKLAVQMQQIILKDNAYVFCSHLRMSMIAKKGVSGLIAHSCDYYEITVDLDIS